jgi:peptidoglycan/LPS O-acetylase OafA/YrhL
VKRALTGTVDTTMSAQRLSEAPLDTHDLSLGRRFDPRRNSVNAVRLGLAGLVLLSHTIQLSSGGREDPVGRLTDSHVDLSTMAVDGFFALSGFLITGSYLSSPSVWRYLWRRALRILPGFWVCLVVTAAVIAPLTWWLEHRTLAGYPVVGPDSATTYVVQNAGVLIRRYYIEGAFHGEVVNGSLHTLYYESLCYLLLAVIGVLGILRRRPLLVLGMFGIAWLATLVEAVTQNGLVTGQPARELMLRYGTMFLAGALAHLFADRIRLTARGGLFAGLLLAGAVGVAVPVQGDERSILAYSLLAPPAVAYLVLLAGADTRLAAVGSRRDLSYGLYVYAWPVQATLLVVGADAWWLPGYVVASLAPALALAYLSWTFVEAPALALKSWTPKIVVWHSQRRRARGAARSDGREGMNGV